MTHKWKKDTNPGVNAKNERIPAGLLSLVVLPDIH